MAGQAALCAGVGASKVRANHRATAGWKAAGMVRLKHSRSLTRGVKSPARPLSRRCRRMWEEDVESAARRKVAWLIGIVVAAVIAFGGWYWYASRQRPAAATPVAAPAAPP